MKDFPCNMTLLVPLRNEQVTLYSVAFATPAAVNVQDKQLQEEAVQARTVFWPTPLTSL